MSSIYGESQLPDGKLVKREEEFVVYPPGYDPDQDDYFEFTSFPDALSKAITLGEESHIVVKLHDYFEGGDMKESMYSPVELMVTWSGWIVKGKDWKLGEKLDV